MLFSAGGVSPHISRFSSELFLEIRKSCKRLTPCCSYFMEILRFSKQGHFSEKLWILDPFLSHNNSGTKFIVFL